MKNKKLFTGGLSAFIYTIYYCLLKFAFPDNNSYLDAILMNIIGLGISWSIAFPLADVIFKSKNQD